MLGDSLGDSESRQGRSAVSSREGECLERLIFFVIYEVFTCRERALILRREQGGDEGVWVGGEMVKGMGKKTGSLCKISDLIEECCLAE